MCDEMEQKGTGTDGLPFVSVTKLFSSSAWSINFSLRMFAAKIAILESQGALSLSLLTVVQVMVSARVRVGLEMMEGCCNKREKIY